MKDERLALKEAWLDLNDETVCGVRDGEDRQTDNVPCGTRSETGSRTIRQAELVSMWKYMLSNDYAGKRLELYKFMNERLRRGYLSPVVGFRVLNRRIDGAAMKLDGVSFRKIDRESFRADIEVTMNLQSPTGPQVWNGVLECWCWFDEDGFSLIPETVIPSTDRKEEDGERLDQFLIPIMNRKELDREADRMWTEFGIPEALRTPASRNAEELAKRMGLTIRYLDVYDHRNMNSIVFFEDAELTVGEDRTERQADDSVRVFRTASPHKEHIAADTIVVNTNRVKKKHAGFCILHECVHYRLHYLFYRLQALASNDRRLLKIREVEAEEGKQLKDPLGLMENQADRVALALMMPAEDTQLRIEEESRKIGVCSNEGERYEKIGKTLSAQLGYPHFRIRARMLQLGHIDARGALNYDRKRRLFRPFGCGTMGWGGSEATYVIREETVSELCRRDEDFRAVMDTGEFVYADGHVVQNRARFVREEGGRLFLTEEAARQVDGCCLRFGRRYVQRDVGDYVQGRMYYDPHLAEQTTFYLSDLVNREKLDMLAARSKYEEHFPRTFVEAFDLLMEKNNETREITAERLHISTDTLNRWLHNPEEKISFDFVVRITLMWQIPYWISDLLLDRGYVHVNKHDRRHQALENIRREQWDRGIGAANEYLTSLGLEQLEGYEERSTEFKAERRRRSCKRLAGCLPESAKKAELSRPENIFLLDATEGHFWDRF